MRDLATFLRLLSCQRVAMLAIVNTYGEGVMKRFPQIVAAVALVQLFLMPSTGSAAKLQADIIDSNDREARYLVSWEAGMLTAGTIYGSLNRANKKIVVKSQEFCAAQGFDLWRFASLGEIADDETLNAAWNIATGGTGKSHSTERTGSLLTGIETHNRVRRILILNKVDGARGPCRQADGPVDTSPPAGRSAAADVEPDALESRRAAAEQGDPEAQNQLGEMYASGQGVARDFRQAAKWYRQAAEQGHGPAQLNLGLAYAEGLGVPGDHIQAHLWFNLASTGGDEQARAKRDELTEKMTSEQIAEAQRLAREWWERPDDSASLDQGDHAP